MAAESQSLGALLRRSRRQAGLTQEELAEHAGISVRSLSNIERGAQLRPHISTVRRLVDALGLPEERRLQLLRAVDANSPDAVGGDGTAGVYDLEEDDMGQILRAETPAILTFLIADLRDYTRFTMKRGDEAAARLIATFAELTDAVVGEHDGRVIELRGDEALCVFVSARNALRAAVALEARCAEATEADPSFPLRVGMGLDAGEAIPVAGGYRGAPLNLAARLCSLAGAGEVFATRTVLDLVRVTEGLRFLDRGEVVLKGLSEPVRVAQILAKGVEPRAQRPLQTAVAVHPTNLPDQPNPFVGREQDVSAICSLLHQPGVRLVTLTGPGGVGKTRLALELGSSLLYGFRDGVFFVSLDSLADPDLVAATIASALGLREGDSVPAEDVVRGHLREKHVLLVLDNFEHLIEAALSIARLLEGCPELHVLATSRIPLHLTREHEYPVLPLPVPEPAQLLSGALERNEAVALFIERARSVKPNFALTEDNAPAVSQICRRLDGLPLALELAAARVKSLPPQLLLDQLNAAYGTGSLEMLAGGARDLPLRLQSMRNAIAWSHDLLEPDRQALFRRLGVFVDGCTLETAESICRSSGDPPVLNGLVDLVDQSLVRSQETRGGETRFFMLETIRECARELLRDSGEAESVQERHAAYFTALATAAEPELIGPNQEEWFERLEREHGNLRAALSWLQRHPEMGSGAELASSLWRFWQVRGHLNEGSRWLERVLQVDGLPVDLRIKALQGRGALAHSLGNYALATEVAAESLDLSRNVGETRGAAHALVMLAYVANDRGEYEQSAAQYSQALELFRELRDRVFIAQTLNDLACVLSHQGAFEQAHALFSEGLSLSRDLGDTRATAIALLNLGDLAVQQGDWGRSIELFEASLELRRQLGDDAGISLCLANLGEALWLLGEHDRAASVLLESLALSDRSGHRRAAAYCLMPLAAVTAAQGHLSRSACLWGIAESWCERMDIVIPPGILARYDLPRSSARAALGEAEWSTAWQRGRALSADAAITYALEDQLEKVPENEPTQLPANVVDIAQAGVTQPSQPDSYPA